MDLHAAVELLEVARSDGGVCTPVSCEENEQRVTDALGSHHGFGRSGQRLFEQRRYVERKIDVVEYSHHDCVVTTRSGDGYGLVGQGVPALKWTSVCEL